MRSIRKKLVLMLVIFTLVSMFPLQSFAMTESTKTSQPQVVWSFLYKKIGNPYGVAGLMGNLKAESGLLAINLQGSYEKKLGYTDISYTNAVDNGKYSQKSFVPRTECGFAVLEIILPSLGYFALTYSFR